tara:strand:+ start:7222 stop:7500 length:279 start_codon:yes stop_codon:yes gene_type:complete
MDKLFERLLELGVSVMIPTKKGVLIPAEEVVTRSLDIAELKPLVPSGYTITVLPKQYRDDPCGSYFIGLAREVNPKDVQAKALEHLTALKEG